MAFLVSALLPLTAGADGILEISERPNLGFQRTTFFPNWNMVPTASFMLLECPDTVCLSCTASSIVGLTVVNYGTATGADIPSVYFNIVCGTKNNSGIVAMTYDGLYTYGAETHPAWTWPGTYLFAANADPCDGPTQGCSCEVSLFLYVDVAPCPTEGATVQLGFPEAGMNDNCPMSGPWSDVKDSIAKDIRYVLKSVDKAEAAAGDTVRYSIYVSKPGAVPTQTVVMDTIPGYMHLVPGSVIPPADQYFDPEPGPPMRLRWTLPSTTIITGGATRELTFSATVDWGNLSDYQAGETGAPEGLRLWNSAQAFWPASDCGVKTHVSPPVRTVVSRFLFWKVANNDLLFASDPSRDDVIEYEIFIKNKSNTKTWWDVTVWDTVPAGLDVWWPGFGLHDDCVGFTMTPTGCARASAGSVTTGVSTILTWRLDVPPSGTQVLRWRAMVRPTTSAGSFIISNVLLRAYGKPWIVDGGTGDSQVPIGFVHQAPVVLRTSYFSYNSYAASADDGYAESSFFIVFFPLNVDTSFELYKLEYTAGASVAGIGGASASINNLVGGCGGGRDFSSDGGTFSTAGCGLERKPALYWPGIWDEADYDYPLDFLYKVSSNSPFLWMIMSELYLGGEDALTYCPATSLSYRGFVHYTLCRVEHASLNVPGHGDRLVIISAAMDFNNTIRSDLYTNVHIFKWSWASSGWDYLKSGSIDPEGAWVPLEGTYGAFVEDNSIYRIISSDSQNIVYQGDGTLGAPGIGGAFDNHGTMVPNRENGNLVSNPGEPATFFPICHPLYGPNCVIGNVGSVDATYRIWQYVPYNMSVPDGNWPPTLAGTGGYYLLRATHTVPAGRDTPGNPHPYGAGIDSAMTNSMFFATLWKIELINGGPIQVTAGGSVYTTFGGAATLHAADGHSAGSEFWFFLARGGGYGCPTSHTYVINTFCPRKGMDVEMQTATSSASYSTTGPDQAIVWMPFSALASGGRPYQIKVTAKGEQGSMVAQYHQCMYDEKFLSAPFVESGVHYNIYAPAVVYMGQSFWLTVVVAGPAGGTQTDYCGTIDFTSSDSRAIFGNDLYGWTSDAVGCSSGSPSDNGVHLFLNVVFNTLGPHTIVANDTVDGMITGLASLKVIGAAVNLTKEPTLVLASSGETVQFRICWSN